VQVPNSTQYLPILYNEFKFWSAVSGAFWLVFKGVTWVKEIRTNDLVHIQAGVDSLKKEISDQTGSIVKSMVDNTQELKELRRDLFNAFVAPPRARAARAAKRKK
jgi:hypothetical protein